MPPASVGGFSKQKSLSLMIEIIQFTTGIMDALSAMLTSLSTLIPQIIAGASVLAAFMPPPDGESTLAKVHAAINWIAFNFKHATNRPAE